MVRIYISLLKESKTPAILEASAGAIQNLCAGSWMVSALWSWLCPHSSVLQGRGPWGASPLGYQQSCRWPRLCCFRMFTLCMAHYPRRYCSAAQFRCGTGISCALEGLCTACQLCLPKGCLSLSLPAAGSLPVLPFCTLGAGDEVLGLLYSPFTCILLVFMERLSGKPCLPGLQGGASGQEQDLCSLSHCG